MNVEVVNTGTELLLGSVINSHLAYFGQALFPLGLRISRQTAVPDGDAMEQAIVEAMARCDLLLVTGGLGPTSDDITREIVAQRLGLELELDEGILQGIRDRCAYRGYIFQERMARQAMVPRGATVLPNENGTAPGLYLPPGGEGAPHLFLLPGPPRELKPMFEAYVLPRIAALTQGADRTECRIYRCVGIGESTVEAKLGGTLAAIEGLEIGYCARPNEVDLRLIGLPAVLDVAEKSVLAELAEFLVSTSGEELETVVVNRLIEAGATVATAESCTGGLLANRITDVPGASGIFHRGYVTYSNEAKASLLGVDPAVLAEHGAVSEPVARAMAEGARRNAGARFGLSTTGIAGPSGGTPTKPVGTVFIGLAEEGREPIAWREFFPTDRATFKQHVTQAALNALRKRLAESF